MGVIFDSGKTQEYSQEQLEKMTYEELAVLEDKLVLDSENFSNLRSRVSSGKVFLFVLTAIYWGIFFLIVSIPFRKVAKNPLVGLITAALVFVTLFLAVMAAGRTWRSLPPMARHWLRLSMHYWPVTFFVLMTVASLFMKR